MEQRIIAQFADDCGCSVTGGDKGFTFSRCKLHAQAPALLEALEKIRDEVSGEYSKHRASVASVRFIRDQANTVIEAAK